MSNEIKFAAREILEHLPGDATWDDLIRALDLRKKIERGLRESAANDVSSLSEVHREFRLAE